MASDHYTYYLLAVFLLWVIGLTFQILFRLLSPKRKRIALRVDFNLLPKGEKWQSKRFNSGYYVGGLLSASLVLVLLFIYPLLTFLASAPEGEMGLFNAEVLILVTVCVWFLVYLFSGLKGDLRWKDGSVKTTQGDE